MLGVTRGVEWWRVSVGNGRVARLWGWVVSEIETERESTIWLAGAVAVYWMAVCLRQASAIDYPGIVHIEGGVAVLM